MFVAVKKNRLLAAPVALDFSKGQLVDFMRKRRLPTCAKTEPRWATLPCLCHFRNVKVHNSRGLRVDRFRKKQSNAGSLPLVLLLQVVLPLEVLTQGPWIGLVCPLPPTIFPLRDLGGSCVSCGSNGSYGSYHSFGSYEIP